MGRCILCGKSAGLFYSLHKACYQKFQSSTDPIVTLLHDRLSHDSASVLAKNLTQDIEQFNFVAEAQQRTLVRALEKFAEQEFEHKQQITMSCSAWLDLLDHLSLDESLFINPHFIAQQRALPQIKSLHDGDLPTCNCEEEDFPEALAADEQLWWCFSNTLLDRLQPKQEKRQWSVIMHILQSALPRKHKPTLQSKQLGEGTLWLTNKRICFDSNAENTSIKYSDIFALTPEYDGVTLQLKELNSMPQTFHCQQGVLLFQFVRHAQTMKN